MTREQVNATLRMMEQCSENINEAESRKEQIRLQRQYSLMWASIQPYVTKQEPYDDEPAQSPQLGMTR